MAEIQVCTAWRWSCPHCGMRQILMSSATRPQGSSLMSEIADHFTNDHKIASDHRIDGVVQIHRLMEPVFMLNLTTGVLVG